MTIRLSLRHCDTLDQLAHAVYAALCAADCPDLASKSAAVQRQARDADEYMKAVLKLSDELRVEWEKDRR